VLLNHPFVPRGIVAVASALCAAAALAQSPVALDLAAQPLDKALSALARQSGARIAFSTDLTEGRAAPAVSGNLTVEQALERLLAGSGLVVRSTGDGAYTVAPAPVAGEGARLPSVKVTAAVEAESAWGPVKGYVARDSGTGTKTDTPLNEVPQSVSVVTADQIRDQGSQSMESVLRYSPGVRHEAYGLDNRMDSIAIRGTSASVLRDGLKQPRAGWWGAVREEPYGFERVEVLRGPSSIVAGQNAPGGLLNLVSKRPRAEPVQEMGAQAGTDDHRQVHADLGGSFTPDHTLMFRVVGVALDTGTQVNHADEQRYFLAPSLTWKPLAGTTWTVYAEAKKDRSNTTNSFFPQLGTLYDAPNGKIPRDTFISEPAWDGYAGTRYRLGWELDQRLGADWTLRHHFRHDETRGELRSMFAFRAAGFVNADGTPNPNGTHFRRAWYASDEAQKATAADLLFEREVRTGPVDHHVLVGADLLVARSGRTYSVALADTLDVYNPVYGTFPKPDRVYPAPSLDHTRNVGVVLQDQMKIDRRWVLLAALRHDDVATTPPNGATAEHDDAWSKNFGVVWLGDGGWSPYASYTESFEPVSGQDFFGTTFKPRRGKQVEAGVKWQPADLPLRASAAVYKLRETNRLTVDPDHEGESTQLGEATIRGVELELIADFAAWELMAQYTYTQARVTRAQGDETRYVGQQIEGVPRESAGVWGVYKFGGWGVPGLRAGLGARRVGANPDGVGRVWAPPVTLHDAMVGFDAGRWRLALNINNLSDKDYIAYCGEGGDCSYGTRRKAVASVSYRW